MNRYQKFNLIYIVKVFDQTYDSNISNPLDNNTAYYFR